MPAKKKQTSSLRHAKKAELEKFAEDIVLSGDQIRPILRSFMNKKKKATDATDATGESSGTNSGMMLGPLDEANDATANETYTIEPPDDLTRLFAVRYLPVAYRITHGVAQDAWKSGDEIPFRFVTVDAHDAQEAEWNGDAIAEMRKVGFFKTGPMVMGNGEQDGEAFLILLENGFDWQTTDVSKPLLPDVPIVQTMCLPKCFIRYGQACKGPDDWNLDGTPKYYEVQVFSQSGTGLNVPGSKRFHCSRVLHYTPESITMDMKGLCTLERCWNAILIGFNIDLACGEYAFRWGMGHPVIETPYQDVKDLKMFMDKLGNPTRRTWHALLKDMKLTYAGASSGTSQGLESLKENACWDEIVVATGIPRPIIKGEVTGVHEGSQVNERTYWGTLRHKQSIFSSFNWKFLAVLNKQNGLGIDKLDWDYETGNLTLPENTSMRWSVHYVETEGERIKIINEKLDAVNKMHDWATINEIRKLARDLLHWGDDDLPQLDKIIGDQFLTTFVANTNAEAQIKIVEGTVEAESNIDPEGERGQTVGGSNKGGPFNNKKGVQANLKKSEEPISKGSGTTETGEGKRHIGSSQQLVGPGGRGETKNRTATRNTPVSSGNPLSPGKTPASNKIGGDAESEGDRAGTQLAWYVGLPPTICKVCNKEIDPRVSLDPTEFLLHTHRGCVRPGEFQHSKERYLLEHKIDPDGVSESDIQSLVNNMLYGGQENEEEKEETPEWVGCPDHQKFNSQCPACRMILEAKKDLSTGLLSMGYSLRMVQKFMHIDYNTVQNLRADALPKLPKLPKIDEKPIEQPNNESETITSPKPKEPEQTDKKEVSTHDKQ